MYCIEFTKGLWHHPSGNWCVPMSLDDRIRELCAKAIAEHDPHELERILAELNLALRQHSERLRALLAHYPILRSDQLTDA
jgi:uncharacterized coiled-coil protein SlyX